MVREQGGWLRYQGADIMSDAKKKETAKEKKTPSIRVKARGRISGLMDQLGDAYRKHFPDRDCRWVYAPTHKPELSNVLSRRAQGYEEVCICDLPEAEGLMAGLSPDDVVRVADTILMSIEAELREIFKSDLHSEAVEQSERVERKYYEELRALEEEAKTGSKHKVTPRGRLTIEEKTLEYEYEQRPNEPEEGG